MSEIPQKYRKLPGRGPGLVGIARIWMGEDHLLAVDTTFAVERYRRYYYRDIEAIVVRKTRAGMGWNIAFGAVALLMTAIIVVILVVSRGSNDGVGGAIFVGCLAAVALFFLLINTLRGPTCSVHVQTTSGLNALGCPIRMRPARKVLAKLQPVIEAAQGADSAVAHHPTPAGSVNSGVAV